MYFTLFPPNKHLTISLLPILWEFFSVKPRLVWAYHHHHHNCKHIGVMPDNTVHSKHWGLLWSELCPPQIQMLEWQFQPTVPQNVTVFGVGWKPNKISPHSPQPCQEKNKKTKKPHPKLFLPKSVLSEFKSPLILHHFILCPPCIASLASSKWKGNAAF